MPRNILCLIVCAILCLALVGCSSGEDSSGGDNSPSILTTLGENPEISLLIGEVKSIAFKVNSDDPIFQSDFSVSVSASEVADVVYYGISGDYVYYKIIAKAEGTTKIYLEMPSLSIRSESITINVGCASFDKIYASLGEDSVISIPETSTKTVCFYISEGILPEQVKIVVSDENIATVSFDKSSGAYFYYKISALTKGSAEIYAELIESGVKSETVKVSVVAKGTLPEYEEMTEGYICNSNTKIYHKPTCASAKKISDENKVIYDSNDDLAEILSAGYNPCKTCNP